MTKEQIGQLGFLCDMARTIICSPAAGHPDATKATARQLIEISKTLSSSEILDDPELEYLLNWAKQIVSNATTERLPGSASAHLV